MNNTRLRNTFTDLGWTFAVLLGGGLIALAIALGLYLGGKW